MFSRAGRPLALLFSAALAIRIAFCLFYAARLAPADGSLRYPDERAYLGSARTLAETGEFKDGSERAKWPPFYPASLSAGLRLGADVDSFRFAQAVLGAVSCLLLVLLARRWVPGPWALACGWALALWPHAIAYTPLLLTETLFTFLFLAMLVLLLEERWAWAGVLAAACTLTRASALFLPPLLALPAARHFIRPRWKQVIVFLGIYAALLYPWALRNRLVVGAWLPVTSKLGFELYQGIHPGADGSARIEAIAFPACAVKVPGGEAEEDLVLRRAALQLIRRDPIRFLKLGCIKAARLWDPIPNDPGHRSFWIAVPLAITAGPAFLLALLGARALWRRGLPAWPIWAPILYFTAVHFVTVGSIRYRLPLEPLILILAATAIAGGKDPRPAVESAP